MEYEELPGILCSCEECEVIVIAWVEIFSDSEHGEANRESYFTNPESISQGSRTLMTFLSGVETNMYGKVDMIITGFQHHLSDVYLFFMPNIFWL